MNDILDDNFNDGPKEDDFQFYKSFHQIENAEEYLLLLKENEIPYRVASSEALLDEAIVGTGLMPKVVLKVLPQDFQKIAYLVEEELNRPDLDLSGHYLSQLSDDELLQIFDVPDEWTVEDGVIAQRLLEQRGKPISRESIVQKRKERFEKIRKGKHVEPSVIALYFVGVVIGFFIHVIFIIAGIGMAIYYSSSKSVDPDGNKYDTFDEETRRYGGYLFYGSIVVLILEIGWLVMSSR